MQHVHNSRAPVLLIKARKQRGTRRILLVDMDYTRPTKHLAVMRNGFLTTISTVLMASKHHNELPPITRCRIWDGHTNTNCSWTQVDVFAAFAHKRRSPLMERKRVFSRHVISIRVGYIPRPRTADAYIVSTPPRYKRSKDMLAHSPKAVCAADTREEPRHASRQNTHPAYRNDAADAQAHCRAARLAKADAPPGPTDTVQPRPYLPSGLQPGLDPADTLRDGPAPHTERARTDGTPPARPKQILKRA